MKNQMNGMKEINRDEIRNKYFMKEKKKINLIKSTEDYELWKEQTRQIYYNKFPKEKDSTDKFIKYLSSRLDKYQRSFLPRKILYYLWGKRNWLIKNKQHLWIGLIGKEGGEGKTTIADYLSMFWDTTYDKHRCKTIYDDWLSEIPKAVNDTRYPALVLDEQDKKTHPLSSKGREETDIKERIRCLNLFVCTCANSLSSIPPSIYSRLSVLIYVDKQHKFWVWDSSKDKIKGTIIDEIKGPKGWGLYGYGVFKEPTFVKRAFFKHLGFTNPKFSPFKQEAYEDKKRKDILDRIQKLSEKSKVKSKIEGQGDRVLNEIRKMKKKNPTITDEQIGLRLGYARETINRLRNKAMRCDTPQL